MSEAQPEKATASPALTLTALGLLVGMAVGAMIYFKAGWPVWVMAVLTVALIATATLGLADAASRNFLAGTLRHRTYTQIYRTLVGRRHARLWAALCDPVDDNASLPATFRAALTWRLYDRALLLAVAYPLALPVLWWLVSGQAAQLGTSVLLAATDGWRDVWPERAAALGAIVILSAGFVGQKLASASLRRSWRKAALLSPIVILALTYAVIVLSGGDVGLAFIFGLLIVSFVPAASTRNGGVAIANAFFGGVIASILGLVIAPVVSVLLVEGAGLVTIVTAIAGSFILLAATAFALMAVFACGTAVRSLDSTGRPRLARWLVTLGAALLWVLAAVLLPWERADDFHRSIFIFLGVFPLLNALFDVLSYAVTLTLIHRGLHAPLPVLYGVADLVLGLLLFLGLGVTLVAVISILNAIAGTDILDVRALLADVRADPHAYWWLYAMVFSTILPTALHGLLAALGVQGIWPRALRRPVADWVYSADRTQLHNLRAAFALGLLWAVPVCVVIALGWGLWHVGADAARAFAEGYLSVLEWTAALFFVGEAP